MRRLTLLAGILASAVTACSSTQASGEPDGSARDAGVQGVEGGAPVIKSPGSVDGGVSAPCTDSSNCATGLSCVDGACFG